MASGINIPSIQSRGLYQGKSCRLVLKEDSLCLEEESEKAEAPLVLFSVPHEDVIGLKVPTPPSSADLRPPSGRMCRTELCLYQRKDPSAVVSPRSLSKELIDFSESEDFDANHRAAMEWREAIQLQRITNNKRVFMCTPEQSTSMCLNDILLQMVVAFSFSE